MAKKNLKIYSVSEVNTLIKIALEEALPSRMVVSGEISSWNEHRSGHCYFSLKENGSQIPCIMWRSSFGKCKFEPENGISVLATGYVDIYPPQGKLQFYVDKLEPAGIGSLQLAFEKMVGKLQAEGLFGEEHKKPLPRYPEKIGILTSESGAAIGDIVDSIYNRWSAVELFLYPVPVQGEGASREIAKAINTINRKNKSYKLDLLIVGRGGGSMEDLWAFNEEIVARAIFNSKIPVISAVGHEYDTTIADLVADARASTPTKAGVLAVPDQMQVLSDLSQFDNRLKGLVLRNFELSLANLRAVEASRVFRNPISIIEIQKQQVDEITNTLCSSIMKKIAEKTVKTDHISDRIKRLEPQVRLRDKLLELNRFETILIDHTSKFFDSRSKIYENIGYKLSTATQNKLTKAQNLLSNLEHRLLAINPKSVLKRGYSITVNKRTGKLVKSAKEVQQSDQLSTEVADGSIIKSSVSNE